MIIPVREYAEEMPVKLKGTADTPVIEADNECGYNSTQVDLNDLVDYLCKTGLVVRTALSLQDWFVMVMNTLESGE